jgi:hypothetical protein
MGRQIFDDRTYLAADELLGRDVFEKSYNLEKFWFHSVVISPRGMITLQVLERVGDDEGAKTGRREGRFLDLAGRRLNNGKA